MDTNPLGVLHVTTQHRKKCAVEAFDVIVCLWMVRCFESVHDLQDVKNALEEEQPKLRAALDK